MKNIKADIAVIGAGPAGLAAAVSAHEQGVKNIILLERDNFLGGILNQCIHDGFGLQTMGRRMSGPEFAQHYVDKVLEYGIKVMSDTMVLEITADKKIYACGKEAGMVLIEAKAIILAMGCRERTAGQIQLLGERPAGVLTSGAVQRYINIEGYLPGREAVILGSGDIGLIMARRMTLEGIKVKGVYEAMPQPGGLTRNIVQCLEDFNIPLYLSHTVSCVHGKKRIEAVTVAELDENFRPIPGSEKKIPCDLLVLAVGLIPENELSLKAGIELDERTKGPVLNERFMSSVPGIFACGNVSVVFDLVDYVAQSGAIAGRGAAEYIAEGMPADEKTKEVRLSGNLSFVLPQRIRENCSEDKKLFFMRVKEHEGPSVLSVKSGEERIYRELKNHVAPPEMILCKVKTRRDKELLFSMAEQEAEA